MFKTIFGLLLACSFSLAVPFCVPPKEELEFNQLKTFCDSNFCVCNDPYGRVHCQCSSEVQVDEVIVTSSGPCAIPQEATALTIENCDNVTVLNRAFSELKELQYVTLFNIKELFIENEAFRWKGHGLVVNMTNVTVIRDVPNFAFSGNIESIVFDGCYIGMIRAFAFSNIEYAQRILFNDTNVAKVESQAFKKFPVSKFVIANSQFNVIPSRFLFDVDVENLFKIENTFIEIIKTAGFIVKSPKVTIIMDCRINTIESEAFRIRTSGDVVMQNIVFNNIEREAFRGMFVEQYVIQHVGKPMFRFLNNTVNNYEEKTFYYNRTSFEAQFSRIMIDEVCTCDGLERWRGMIHESHTTGKKNIEEDVETFWCHLEDKETNAGYMNGKDYYKTNCSTINKSIFFFIVIVTATTIGLVLILIFIVCFFRRRKKWSLVPVNPKDKEQPAKPKTNSKTPDAKAIIVPDGRTYRETEFHVIVEKAEPLDVGYIPCKVVRDRSRSQINSK